MILAMSCLFLSGCIERFEPEVDSYESLMVVEGLITDQAEPYIIKISRSTAVNSPYTWSESGAQVSVADSEGATWYFAEVGEGVYQSNPLDFIGRVGETYKLRITTSDLRYYESAGVVLKSSPPIDSIYYQQDIRYNNSGAVIQDGIKVLIDSHSEKKGTGYYKFNWTATYQVKVPYAPNKELQICYNSDYSTNVLVESTLALTEDRVSGFELNYVSTESYRLRSVYSILVRQYALDENGFRYWKELQKSSENLGTLFDPQPYSIVGNVKNINNPDEMVLGYFDASAVSEKRLYIHRKRLAEEGVTYPPDGCVYQLQAVGGGGSVPDGFCFAYAGDYGSGINYFAPCECTDCRHFGTQGEPDFWEN